MTDSRRRHRRRSVARWSSLARSWSSWSHSSSCHRGRRLAGMVVCRWRLCWWEDGSVGGGDHLPAAAVTVSADWVAGSHQCLRTAGPGPGRGAAERLRASRRDEAEAATVTVPEGGSGTVTVAMPSSPVVAASGEVAAAHEQRDRVGRAPGWFLRQQAHDGRAVGGEDDGRASTGRRTDRPRRPAPAPAPAGRGCPGSLRPACRAPAPAQHWRVRWTPGCRRPHPGRSSGTPPTSPQP